MNVLITLGCHGAARALRAPVAPVGEELMAIHPGRSSPCLPTRRLCVELGAAGQVPAARELTWSAVAETV
jgi:hypothetical protein